MTNKSFKDISDLKFVVEKVEEFVTRNVGATTSFTTITVKGEIATNFTVAGISFRILIADHATASLMDIRRKIANVVRESIAVVYKDAFSKTLEYYGIIEKLSAELVFNGLITNAYSVLVYDGSGKEIHSVVYNAKNDPSLEARWDVEFLLATKKYKTAI